LDFGLSFFPRVVVDAGLFSVLEFDFDFGFLIGSDWAVLFFLFLVYLPSLLVLGCSVAFSWFFSLKEQVADLGVVNRT
jgi:hypothetical protein